MTSLRLRPSVHGMAPESPGSPQTKTTHGVARAAAVFALCAAALSACGSSPAPSSISSSSTTAGTTASNNATASIEKNWAEFFSGTTPAATKISLLENGSQFRTIIDGQAGSSLAKSAAAKISKVTETSATSARVTYTVTLGGQPALTNQTGEAVLQGGVWRVGSASFCGLLALEQVTTPACPTSSPTT